MRRGESLKGSLLAAFLELREARYISVTTYRRNGEPVATPVEFVFRDSDLYFRTLPESGKVKRLRNNPRVTVAPCTMRGRVTGEPFHGHATLLDERQSHALRDEFAGKYGLLWLIGSKLRRPRGQGVVIKLDLRDSGTGPEVEPGAA